MTAQRAYGDVDRWDWERGLRCSLTAGRAVPLSLATRGVLFALASRMDRDGSTRRHPAYVSHAALAVDLGVSPRVVKDHLAVAQRAGYLRREGASYVGHVAPYVACLPPPEGTTPAPPSAHPEGTAHTPPPQGEGTCHTSQRGRVTRRRGGV